MSGWTASRYALLRVALGGYLLAHFVELAPWAGELFGSEGMLPARDASPLIHAFPNVLALCDAPWAVSAWVVLGAALCVPLIAGRGDRIAAVALWFVWACLLGRNPLITNPSLPYVGLLLLAHASTGPRGEGWRMSPRLHRALWIAMAVGYSYSGLTKLASPSWIDGTAVRWILENPLARPTALRLWILSAPDWLFALFTWATLGLEIAFAPLALHPRARPWLWAAMLALHLVLLVLIDFADLTLGMVLLHAFTFDPDWLPRRACQSEEEPSRALIAAPTTPPVA